MKKIGFQKLSNADIFANFQVNKLNSAQGEMLNGGTSTALCKTVEDKDDKDSQSSQEVLNDQRCSGY